MKKIATSSAILGALLLQCLVITPALAQATRTWVSGVGDDANPCSRTAPCKTFAGAISKTAARGEIDVLDPGGFGAVTITKSMTIDTGGVGVGSVLNTGGSNGIIVNAGVNDVVTLRNLSINGAGSGLNGIKFIAGGALHVENTQIFGQTGYGVDFEPTTASQIFMQDVIARDNGTGGVLVKPVSVLVSGSLDHVRMDHNFRGLRVEDNTDITIRDCDASGNTHKGIEAVSTSLAATLNVENSVFSGDTYGVTADGALATVRLSNVDIFDNSVGGITSLNSGKIVSFSNNRNAGTNPGGPTSITAQQ